MTTVGELSLGLLLDIKPFGLATKSALNILSIFQKQAKDLLDLKGIKPNFSGIDSQIKSLDNSLQRYRSELQKTEQTLDQTSGATNKLSTQTVTLSDRLQNAYLRVEGFKSIVSLLHNTFGSLIDDYTKQEVALSKLTNALTNIGEGSGALEKLTKQSSELQNTTPFADEDINNAQAMLAVYGKSSEEISILTPRILDLAAASQTSGENTMDLQQISKLLGRVNEESLGTLTRLVGGFSDETTAKLKSLKGTEQAIYLSEILDEKFKGMAQTIGQSTPGQIAIFNNRIGEMKESLGKIASQALIPILNFFKPFIDYLASAPPLVQRLTLGMIALGAAFVILNTSMGGLPYVIGGIVTALYALTAEGGLSKEAMDKLNEETLRTKEVSSGMRKVLDESGIAAKNMAEAYQGLSDAIAFMGRTQLTSAKLFIESEKAKLLALAESSRQIRLNDLARMDFVPKDFGESLKWESEKLFAPDIEKFDGLLKQINSKLAFTTDNTSTSKGSSSVEKIEETVYYLQGLNDELTKIKERISGQSKNESEAEGLFVKKQNLETLISYIKNMESYKKVMSKIAILAGADRGTIDTTAEFELEIFKLKQLAADSEKHSEKMAKEYDKVVSDLQTASSLVSTIAQKLEGGAKGFLFWLAAALTVAKQIASLYKVAASKEGIGFGDILGLIGTVLPFFLSEGGLVPGSGSGDTVPAMLTPGEFVVNKSTMNRLGQGFFNLLNGGGSLHRVLGPYGAQPQNTVIINMNGPLTDALMHKVVSRGNVIVNKKNHDSTY